MEALDTLDSVCLLSRHGCFVSYVFKIGNSTMALLSRLGQEFDKSSNIYPKSFNTTLGVLEWDDVRVQEDGRGLQHLHFSDEVVVTELAISQLECLFTSEKRVKKWDFNRKFRKSIYSSAPAVC